MAFIKKLFDDNFLEYASYVIKDRAIPHIDDGFKPVQRRILHSLFEMDDGKFQKVANVVGHCMKYHPHGDASIFSALVTLANKELFIEKQGNFGNIFTGDEASAARYIECRLLSLAKVILYNPDITEFENSYDGRNREPVSFPAKAPIVLMLGAEGIAVGMATKILPHNLVEVLNAVKNCLHDKPFQLFPDFPTGGFVDVSEYDDGNGKVLVRAKLDISDPKKITITELPFGSTTESLINSVEDAAKKNKIKIASINDFSSENVEIEIKLARGIHSSETVDSLFAFTDCESSISLNLLVIKDGHPSIMTVTDVIGYHANKLVMILKAELLLEERDLKDKLHAKTLEQIFIGNRIYKNIEEMVTKDSIVKAVIDGFIPYTHIIQREVTQDDVDNLLKIPIRRISLYDINKAEKEIQEIEARLKEIKHHLLNLISYATAFLDKIIEKYGTNFPRKTKIISFAQVNVREAAQKNLKLRYDRNTGYLGYKLTNGNVLFDVSHYDRILVIRKSGDHSVISVPEKTFIDKGMLYCGLADIETCEKTVFTIIYRNNESGYPFIKRCRIEKYIMNRDYSLIPDDCTLLKITTVEEASVIVDYKPKPRQRILQENFNIADYAVKNVKAAGIRLASKEIKSVKFTKNIENDDLQSED